MMAPEAELMAPRRRLFVEGGPSAWWLLLAAVAFTALFPVALLLNTSFQVGTFGRATTFGFANWIEAFHSARLGQAMWNTLTLSLARQSVAVVVGVSVAWLIARSNMPGRKWMEVGFWVAMFMPALPVTMAWILLAGGRSGLLNMLARDLHLTDGTLFNVFSWGGIVWVHLLTSTIPIKIFLMAPAFRNMDAALEESARTCGTGIGRTVWKIVVPIMLPVLVVTTLLGLIGAMQSFEIELILGTPRSIEVYSTIIYTAMKQEPPLYGMASVLSLTFVAAVLPFLVLQQWFLRRRTYSVVGGRFAAQVQDLGAWRWPAFAFVLLLLCLMTVVPTAMIVLGTFMKLFGTFNLPHPYTVEHWVEAFSNTELIRSLANTLKLGLGAATCGMVLYTVIAFATVNRQFRGRELLDLATWIPTVVPGIVMSMGILQMFLQLPFLRALYGGVSAMVLAVVIGGMTVGVQVVRGTLHQINAELKEASWTSGAGRMRTVMKIMVPLIAPTVIIVGLQIFGTAVSVVGLVVLLGTGPSQPLSILQLSYLDSGQFEPATIIGLFILAIALAAALLARAVSLRFTLAK